MEKLSTAPKRRPVQPWEEVDFWAKSVNTNLNVGVAQSIYASKARGDAHRILSRAASGFPVTDEEKQYAKETLVLDSFPY